MPQQKAAFKAIKVSEKKALRNQRIINELKRLTKTFNDFTNAKDIEKAKNILLRLIPKINKAKSKGIIHKKAASRKISRIMKKAAKIK